MTKLLNFNITMTKHYGESKSTFILYTVLRLCIIAIIIVLAAQREFDHIWQAVLSLIMFAMPPYFERITKCDLPPVFEKLVLLFICGCNIGGEVFSLYVKIPGWDTVMHTLYGFIFAGFCFSFVNILNKERDVAFKLSPSYLCLTTVATTILFGTFWEFFEFFADQCLGKDMQKDRVVQSFQSVMLDDTNSNIPVVIDDIQKTIIVHSDGSQYVLPFNGYLDIGIWDTMKDTIVAFIGAVVFCFFLVPYIKSKGENKLAKALIPIKRDWKEEPPHTDSKLAKFYLKILNKEKE